MNAFFARMSPLRAWRDLRFFLAGRGPQDLWFLAAAVAITSFLIYAFVVDSYAEKVYRPNIVYVQQWTLDRTDAQIVAQQKIDQAKKDKETAAQHAREEKLRLQFKKLDDQLNRMGI